ncbi:MAG: exosortase F system-associated protein [Flavobacteriaceae bacterium]|nr:exosortase F system-associated protein [Flavobacteriaceae bacterium]
MIHLMLKNKTSLFFIVVILLSLVAIRMYEDVIFYDPFLDYFKANYTSLPLPNYHPVKLFFSLGFRFYLNSMLSLGLLYLLFKDSKIIKFSTFLYVFFGSILMVAFFFMLKVGGAENKMALFYIRRFIIQPIFVILFIPAFYYQKRIK